jgi:hypothetical protein
MQPPMTALIPPPLLLKVSKPSNEEKGENEKKKKITISPFPGGFISNDKRGKKLSSSRIAMITCSI